MSTTSESDTAKSQVNTRPRENRGKVATPTAAKQQPMTAPHFRIQVPPFWPEKPAIWFAQVEGQFAVAEITDDTSKFYHILSTLDRQYAADVEDILTGPPNYERLKAELIKRLSVSRENKVKQLLMHEQLGSRKPSQFLRHLQHLAGPEIPEDFLKTIWISRLPSSMQPIVASQQTLSLDALADLADRINDITVPPQQVAATSSTSTIDELVRQVAELTKQVSALTITRPTRPREREREYSKRSRSTSRRSLSTYRKYPICWYHSKHGTEARKCVKPCDYNKLGNAAGGQ